MRLGYFFTLAIIALSTVYSSENNITTWAPVDTSRPDTGQTIKAMTVNSDSQFSGAAGENNTFGFIADDCRLRITGSIGGNGTIEGQSKTYLFMNGDGNMVFEAAAMLGNNMVDQVNARPWYIIGEDGTQVVEFVAGFAADQTGYVEGVAPEDQTEWNENGLSTLRVERAIYRTNHTRNLPSIHKKAGGTLNHTEHGLLIFSDATWQVRSEAQVYKGGLNYYGDWTLDAHHDVRIVGAYTDDAKILVGNYGDTGFTTTKTGSGTYIIDIPQGYSANSGLHIMEGAVDMHTNPGDPGASFANLGYNWPPENPGQYLAVEIEDGADLRLRAASGLAALDTAGTVRVDVGLDVSGNYTSSSSAHLHISKLSAFPVTVAGRATLAGSLTLPNSISGSSVTLLTADSIAGSWTVTNLPNGYQMVIEADAVRLQQTTLDRAIRLTVFQGGSALETELFVEQAESIQYNQTASTHSVTGLTVSDDAHLEFLVPMLDVPN